MAEVHLQSVTKSFGSQTALADVTMTVPDGSFVVLLGPTGAGKTTLLRMVSGLDAPDAGAVSIGGMAMKGLTPAQRNVAMVFQQYSLYPHLTVRENMEFPLKSPLLRTPRAEIDRKVAEVAEILQISHKLGNKATALSGGEMQRVSIGRALVRNPAVYLMDEPLSSLDAKLRADLRVELKNIQANLGATFLYVTHDQIEAMTLSTRIAVMYQGYVQQLGTPKEIYDTPANVYVATFMGSPAMNVMPAKVAVKDGVPHAQIKDAKGVEQLLKFSQPNLSAWDGSDILLGIRPESITDPDGADRNSRNIVPLRNLVGITEPAGADTFVAMSLGGKDVIARMRADANVVSGQDFDFAINMEKAVAFDPKTEERIKP
jgi:multiple sugar transport system ATP-binding protein